MQSPPKCWLDEQSISEEQRKIHLLEFRLRYAAIFNNRLGSLKHLSRDMGYGPDYLAHCIRKSKLPHKAELTIRSLVGESRFPDEETFIANIL